MTDYRYLATPYRDHPGGLLEAFENACEAAAHCIRHGIRVYCPIAHSHPIALHGGIDPRDHGIWLPQDRPFMDGAVGLIVVKMPGWRDSVGIRAEIAVFERAGKPVDYMDWPLRPGGLEIGGAA